METSEHRWVKTEYFIVQTGKGFRCCYVLFFKLVEEGVFRKLVLSSADGL